MTATGTYTVTAFNTSTASENKIHDDAVARGLGFDGGLVPGVDVYAYLCHLPAERWGDDWVRAGTMRARFVSPVYDGDTVTATMDDDGALRLVDSRGTLCAEGVATLRADKADRSIDIPVAPLSAAAADRPPASTASLPTGATLGTIEVGFHAAKVDEYLDDVREHLDLFRTGAVAHPAWLLRQANYVLSSNVRLGPWIHVSSDATHLDAVRDGDRVTTRARVAATYERKGHKFVDLDVLMVAEPDRAVMRVLHTAIFEPRRRQPA